MNSKNIIFIILFFLFFCCNASAEDTPEWLKRVELSAQWETNKHPTFYFQTVQPFYQSEDNTETFFYQPRVSIKAGDYTYNLGVGYRRILDEDLLLGVNFFGDYEALHEHGRIGLGFEALGQVLEARLNTYVGITSKRLVADTSTTYTYEKVADGFDCELGSPIPYVPWLKFYGSGFWYDFEKSTDKKGWKARLEAEVTEAITMEFFTWDDNKGKQEYGGRLRCSVDFDTIADFKDIFKLAEQSFPKRDLKEFTLKPVEREYNIVVEKWTENASGNVTVVIGRAD